MLGDIWFLSLSYIVKKLFEKLKTILLILLLANISPLNSFILLSVFIRDKNSLILNVLIKITACQIIHDQIRLTLTPTVYFLVSESHLI